MVQQFILTYSPFSLEELQHESHKILLLQFVLSEIFHAYMLCQKEEPLVKLFSSDTVLFPYAYTTGSLNKIKEYFFLLEKVFPNWKRKALYFHTSLKQLEAMIVKQKNAKSSTPIFWTKAEEIIQRLYHLLLPLIELYYRNENLLHFLLKHQKLLASFSVPSLKNLLLLWHQKGLQDLEELSCAQFQARDFPEQATELKELFKQLESYPPDLPVNFAV